MKTGICKYDYKDQLTKGKTYEVISNYEDGFFTIVNDLHKLDRVSRGMFELPEIELEIETEEDTIEILLDPRNAEIGEIAYLAPDYAKHSGVIRKLKSFTMEIQIGGVIQEIKYSDVRVWREYPADAEIPCQECGGDGYYEEIVCSRPASNCCGGCYSEKPCEECDGTGLYQNN